MAKARYLPSVLGCMIGFGFAGCGAGVIPGVWAGAQVRGPVLGCDPPPLADAQWSCGSVYAGSFLGMVVGAGLGARYARAARRQAADSTPDTEPGRESCCRSQP